MSLFHQEWSQEAYHSRSHMTLRDLPENHIKKCKSVPFKFEEYRANNQLPCLAYERTYMQCLNNYGVKGSRVVPECANIKSFFEDCVHINKFFGLMKRIYPESFIDSQYNRDTPNLEEIGV